MTDDGGSTRETGREWYALRVLSNREFRVRGDLTDAAVESFLPATEVKTRWSDRDKTVMRPIFPGYVFARLDRREIDTVSNTIRGVVQVLGAGAIPLPIPASEIAALQTALASRRPVSLCPYVAGDAVAVKSGPLAGVSGVVRRVKGETRIQIGIEILRRAVSVEIDVCDLKTTK